MLSLVCTHPSPLPLPSSTDLYCCRCRKDISVPLSQPVQTFDGPITSLFVPNGATVFINIVGVNRDHGIWGDDADEWKPERWLAPLPGTVADAHIPGVYSNTYVVVPLLS